MSIVVEKTPQNKEMTITLDKGLFDNIQNIRKRYGFKDDARALDFLFKAVGDTDEKATTLIVNDTEYAPKGYE